MKKFVVLASLISFIHTGYACTVVNIQAKDGTMITGKAMEWGLDMQWQINSVPKGTSFTLSAPSALKLPTVERKTKYPFVGISSAIVPGPLAIIEGQNSVGVSMSGNFLPGFTEYAKVTPADKSYVSILEFGTMALGMYASVAELKKELKPFKVWFDTSLNTGPTPPWLHFIFTDPTGASIVVEFVQGQMKIHDNVANVVTNSPTYDWQLTNLRNYLSLSNVGPESVVFNKHNVTELGQGGGLVGLPADYTPPSRFVRAAYLRHFSEKPQNRAENVQLVSHILNNVDIPLGVSGTKLDGKMTYDHTQWVAIKDLTNHQWHFTNYQNRTNYLTIDLKALFSSNKPASWLVSQLPYQSINITNQLLK